MPSDKPSSRGRWWLGPLIFTVCFFAACAFAWQAHPTARELLAKSISYIFGSLATPFILELSTALIGLTAVLVYNEWKREKEGPDWVLMEVKPTEEQAEIPSAQDGEKKADEHSSSV